ncbi:protein FAM187B [Spea bombifrons]|uniref:protein FAM187B n=1 Tax=Spea bombifrons TaxID=233779 RepID=UPI00234BCD82|nr:protein FAM187B [Spea bombifrons]
MIRVSRITFVMGLVLLAQATISLGEEGITVACAAYNPCKIAVASHNPITLTCVNRPTDASIYWQYRDLSNPSAKPVTLVQGQGSISTIPTKLLELMQRPTLISGDLKILSPEVKNTGVYTCRARGALLAHYTLDVQNAEDIYISHASLGQMVQPNTTFDLGDKGSGEMFTVWEEWQPCDRCGVQGERKKLGFCYARINSSLDLEEKVWPCGLLRAVFKDLPSTHKPELRIEMCEDSCKEPTSSKNEVELLLVDNYYTNLHGDALLKCPTASIYRPVYWERGNVMISRLQQLRGSGPYMLDNTTGGGSLFIPILNQSDTGIYKCFVDHRLAGRFNVIFNEMHYNPEALFDDPMDKMMIGVVLGLVFLVVLSIAIACRKTCKGTIH